MPNTRVKFSELDKIIGSVLKRLRTEAKMSQTDVAKKLGISFQQIQKYEVGSNRVSTATLIKLSEALGLMPVYVLDEIIIEVEEQEKHEETV